ncbi:GAF and ANTAR domain-containing protein [Blastococcus sp. SYSU DS0753]
MTIGGRFDAALARQSDPALAGPEALPLRLSRVCAELLRVDGAGLVLVDGTARRLPLGASDPAAASAERMQFTVGEGPCATAQATGQPVFAVEDDLRRRWPIFADLLLRGTPFRAVVALPLHPGPAGEGALDLYFRRSAAVVELDVFAAGAVGELVSSALSDAAVWSTWTPAEGPDWLRGAAPRQRAAVWEAVGKLGVARDIDPEEALALLRTEAYTSGRSVDEVAAALLSGRRSMEDLRPGD